MFGVKETRVVKDTMGNYRTRNICITNDGKNKEITYYGVGYHSVIQLKSDTNYLKHRENTKELHKTS